MTPILDLTLDEWHRVLTTNLTGTFLVAQYGARAMAKLGRPGSIVTVSSTFGAAPQARGAHYAASKAGVISLTKTLALELGGLGIRVNCVAPGPTESPLMRTVVPEILTRSGMPAAPWVGSDRQTIKL